METVSANMILLNENLESLGHLGQSFGPLASLWRSFSDSWKAPTQVKLPVPCQTQSFTLDASESLVQESSFSE